MKPPSNAFRRAAGFSLIEILVVIVLGGVVMAIGLPNLFNFIQRQKILGITQETAMVLRVARLESIKTANNAVVKLDTTARTVTGYMDLNQNLAQDTNEPALWRLDLPKGITGSVFFPGSTPPTVMVFRSDGSAERGGDFRFQNTKGDQLEATVPVLPTQPTQPVKNVQVQIKKLQGSNWKLQGEGGQSWTWQ